MLPIKALDTLQPIYGLVGFALLIAYVFTGRVSLLAPVGGVLLAKIALDFAFHLWSIHLYRRWGRSQDARPARPRHPRSATGSFHVPGAAPIQARRWAGCPS